MAEITRKRSADRIERQNVIREQRTETISEGSSDKQRIVQPEEIIMPHHESMTALAGEFDALIIERVIEMQRKMRFGFQHNIGRALFFAGLEYRTHDAVRITAHFDRGTAQFVVFQIF